MHCWQLPVKLLYLSGRSPLQHLTKSQQMYYTYWKDKSHISTLSYVIKMKQSGNKQLRGLKLIRKLFKVSMASWEGREHG